VLVACLGDSITAGSPYWDPDPVVRARIDRALDERSQWEWWAGRKDPRLTFRNCGIFGQRTDEIAARLEEAAAGADVLVVQGGINDIAQGRPVEGRGVRCVSVLRATPHDLHDDSGPVQDERRWGSGDPVRGGCAPGVQHVIPWNAVLGLVLLDASVRGRLERLRERLVAGSR